MPPKPHYAPIKIQCVNVSVNKRKYNEFSSIYNKQITLYFPINHVHLNLGYFPIIIFQMYRIIIESVNSHNVG